MFQILLANSYAKNLQFDRLVELTEKSLNSSDVRMRNTLLYFLYSQGYAETTLDLIDSSNIVYSNNIRLLHLKALCLQQSFRHEQALSLFETIERWAIKKHQFYYSGLLHRQYMASQNCRSELSALRGLIDGLAGSPKNFLLDSKSRKNRSIRIAYISEDFCFHPVGLLAQAFVCNHSEKFDVFAYHTGERTDDLTNVYKTKIKLINARKCSNNQLILDLLSREIDILIDLTGYTAGSKTHLLADRIAPLQGSFLGYLGSTGLSNVDFTILDSHHIFVDIQSLYSEKILNLGSTKNCFQPLDFYPDIINREIIYHRPFVYGSFSNTSKFSDELICMWAEILRLTSNSRLILKWKTFRDHLVRDRLLNKFENFGVSRDRVDLREFSHHRDLMPEYQEVDLCLDTYPFSGLYTSLESLWMGVPIVTLVTNRVASRQTYGLLCELGLKSFVAASQEEYIKVAVSMYNNRAVIMEYQVNARTKMRSSSLMQVAQYVEKYEAELVKLLDAKLIGH
jgi:protein O-GlcNAc transferase